MIERVRLVRRPQRWSVTVSACLAIFAAVWWAWEALGLPPAGSNRLGVALAVAAVLSAVAGLPLAAWAGRDGALDPPRGYLSRLSDRGPEEVYPIRPGKWLIGRDPAICDVVVPREFRAAGQRHASLSSDDTRFWIESLHENGTYVLDELIPLNVKRPLTYDQQISLAGPRGSKPDKCTFVLTQRPLPWPRPTPTDNQAGTETAIVLALLADPAGGARLDLDREVRAVDKAVSAARNSGQVLLKPWIAPSLADLGMELYQFRPSILHISGIGSEGEERGIVLPVDDSGGARSASPAELGEFFRVKAPMVRCVVLNACYTPEQGIAIARQAGCVIGTPSLVSEEAALAFVQVLYHGFANGLTIGVAFAQAKKAITRLIPGKHAVPVIHARPETRQQCLT